MNSEKTNKELATKEESLIDYSNTDSILAFATKIGENGLTKLAPKDAMVAILFGKELGMSPMISLTNIYPIQGRGTLSVHMINALLQRAGVVVEVLRDYEPCVYFGFKGEDGKILIQESTNDKGEIVKTPVILREGFADEAAGDHEVKANRIINYKTVLRLTRRLKQPDGTWKDMSVIASYSYNEALAAGLANNPKKEPWLKYPKQMTLNRALSFGGRLIASDTLLGMYETSELADVHNINYNLEDGKVTIINPEKSTNTSSTPITSTVEEASVVEDSNKNASTN